ncbi:hypothetical protein FHS07_001790 [Microbacterium proteolyticum]|uniref:DUF4839 domain-containing protein n=1 Tax=Microbacterium proteolyticum TaxID=1572644 RepID=A0A7W5GF13_9MICO|nr:DUF4839 domain-containing protein [Microbacterium proteolyticum]MBB3158094.1 hypothetical protein [Microbacterium proteolyticum]
MTTDADVAYETKTVRAVRGMESRTIKKWEADGWKLVAQTHGKVQTELTFRRPKPKSRQLLWIIGGGAFALILATIIAFGVLSERNAETAVSAAPVSSESTSEPSAEPSPEPDEVTPSAEPQPEPLVLTPANSPELAALLVLTDYCAPEVAAFAAAHSGQTISFPGYIGAMAPHDGATTRYDFLIGAGDFSESSAPGPAFQFRDVNATNDLQWVGAVPDSIGVGTNLSVTAQVDRYEQSSCLFLLEPVGTAVR